MKTGKIDDSEKFMILAIRVCKIVDAHDKAAAEMEPGFTCGCKTVCQPIFQALEDLGLKSKPKRVKKSR